MCGEGRLSPSPPIVLHALNRRDAPAVQFRPGVCWGGCRKCALPSRPSWRAGRTRGLLAGDVGHGPVTGPVLVWNSGQEELVAGSGGPLLTWCQASVGPYKTRRRIYLTTIGSSRWPDEVEANETETKMRSKRPRRPRPRQRCLGVVPRRSARGQRPSSELGQESKGQV